MNYQYTYEKHMKDLTALKILISESRVKYDHIIGVVRGLLCINCNWMLGKSRDNPDLLRAAANYLERTKESECLTNL